MKNKTTKEIKKKCYLNIKKLDILGTQLDEGHLLEPKDFSRSEKETIRTLRLLGLLSEKM